jgi:hypothetical protein
VAAFLLLHFLCNTLHAQEAARHFIAGVEISTGMATVADFTASSGNYTPILGLQAGLFTSRYFVDQAYFELGVSASRRGNRVSGESQPGGEDDGAYPGIRLYYLDLPLRLYVRVENRPSLASFLFVGGTASALVHWRMDGEESPMESEDALPRKLAASLSYGIAFEYSYVRLKLHANVALQSLFGREEQYGVVYLPYEFLLSCGFVIKP